MTHNKKIRETSKILTDLWLNGKTIETLPDSSLPITKMEAYEIQTYIEKISDFPLFGWKAAATRTRGKKITNIKSPIVGRLIGERQIVNHGSCDLKGNHMCVAEPELAFKISRDFVPQDTPYTIEEVLNGVESLHPAIEIPNTRLENFKKIEASNIIADNALAHEFIIGDPYDDWRNLDLVNLSVIAGTAVLKRTGSGANVMNDPRIALTWVVNELSKYSNTLKSGQLVMTGSYIDPVPVKSGETFEANFDHLGYMSVNFF
ncbi:hypothetical protein N8742_05225 [Emcibacteraceae bacterium]|nr:hypothetical protein [Emcibacteraceae bacterium]MDA9180259.1 hypothetical protein [Emcibacteraceae bacterium]